ncbi:MAG: PIG-L family deacetylase [Pirellulales bacterium]|nr:PIG-L family deacetylase [Pirellulales bacterium]
MRISFAGQRVLAVVAHPDDAEYFCAGTLARAKADGAFVGICVLCQGDKGQPSVPIPDLAEVRRQEMAAAAEVLDAELFRGEFGDGELADGPEQRRVLIELYRRFRPTLVLAHSAADYHSDHRAASALAEASSWYCTSNGHRTESPAMQAQPALWWMDTMNMAGFEPSFYIDVSGYVELKGRMLRCHKSQLERAADGDFSPLSEQMLCQCRARGAQAGVAAAEAFRVHLAWKRVRAW